MDILLRFVLSPVLIVLGVLIMKYSVRITETLGTAGWAEQYLPAGTYTMYKLIGLGIAVLSFLWLVGIYKTSDAVNTPDTPKTTGYLNGVMLS